ncbi:unnamed protein product [Ceratitis capitata]|uniref:(Mediterranean fruit fly) hypothetical protein n=1 Tax=Ceratitis capitata TaxID=7213 RepID=A0A811URM6_CERCA|nr:unnamed protein product [Ceratitis capitata]
MPKQVVKYLLTVSGRNSLGLFYNCHSSSTQQRVAQSSACFIIKNFFKHVMRVKHSAAATTTTTTTTSTSPPSPHRLPLCVGKCAAGVSKVRVLQCATLCLKH